MRRSYLDLQCLHRQYEPAHDKTCNKTCATSEDSDQPAHPRSLISVFSDHMCILKPPGFPKRDEGETLPYWMYVHADLSLCWSHRSYCRFCCAPDHLVRFVLRFYCPVNPMGSCQAWSVYLTTHLLCRLSPLSG